MDCPVVSSSWRRSPRNRAFRGACRWTLGRRIARRSFSPKELRRRTWRDMVVREPGTHIARSPPMVKCVPPHRFSTSPEGPPEAAHSSLLYRVRRRRAPLRSSFPRLPCAPTTCGDRPAVQAQASAAGEWRGRRLRNNCKETIAPCANRNMEPAPFLDTGGPSFNKIMLSRFLIAVGSSVKQTD